MSNNYFILDGNKIEMSDETAANLREQGHVWKHGDVVKNRYGSVRIIISINGKLKSCSQSCSPITDYPEDLQQRAKEYKYNCIGNLFDGNYKSV